MFMRKNKFAGVAMVLAAALIFILLLTSCKGPAGPQGAAGAPGTEFVTSFQQGVWPDPSYAGTNDSFIVDSMANTNFGNCGSAYVGVDTSVNSVYRGVIRFDLTAIMPKTVQVTNAFMTLYGSTSSGSLTVTAYPLTLFFDEGSGTCAGRDNTVIKSMVTWTRVWTTPGGDFSSAPMSNQVYFDSATTGFYPLVFTLDNTIVQNWIAHPELNYGVIIKSANETTGTNYMAFVTRDDVSYAITNRPKLTVYYKLP
jgi:hypothetical protein